MPADLTNPDQDDEIKMIRMHANQLAEHYDSVMVFCARRGGDRDYSINVGVGSYVMRYGHVKMWVLRAEEQERCDARREFGED